MPSFQNPISGQKRKSEPYDLNALSRKKQAQEVGSSAGPSRVDDARSTETWTYWMVQWRVPQHRKHKTWDGDGVLAIYGTKATVYDLDNKILTSGSIYDPIQQGTGYKVGNKEIELDRPISRDDYLSGRCFGGGALTSSSTPVNSGSLSKQFVPLKPVTLNPSNIARDFKAHNAHRKEIPLEPVNLVSSDTTIHDSYWTANWRKPQQKIHKTWDGDAFVTHKGDRLTLTSESGKIVGSKKCTDYPLYSGYKTYIGSKEVQLDNEITASQMPTIIGHAEEPVVDPEYEPGSSSRRTRKDASLGSLGLANSTSATTKFVTPASFYGKAPEKSKKGPLHDPQAEGAVIMKAPTREHILKYNKKNLPIVPVVIDPVLVRRLRDHQKEGVQFMYECVMGLRKHEGQGCILADEMGLGKTLQTIALVWTLLKQNPYVGAGPVVGKVLVVCPVSLVNNWKMEFHKWLGRDRVGVFVGDKDKIKIKEFINSRIHQVLVIGYEKLRTVIEDLAYCNPPIGLIICDEGHRLKSGNNKTSRMFDALKTPRRVILSGTPMQNDLGEFHAMADFCNPGLLDDYPTYRRVYEQPILKSRAPGCTAKEAEIGEARHAQLSTITKSFVLRREASILGDYLPPKFEYVVFVTPTELQLSMFSKVLNADKLDNLIGGSTAESLVLINMLTKISDSPILLKATADKANAVSGQSNNIVKNRVVQEAVKLLPKAARAEDVSLSGKLSALANLLQALRKNTTEKCIIVSHFTSTLNVIEAYCKRKSYTYHRLDGQTATGKRQEYVNEFNKSSQANGFLFLLSAKAGGVGLNLIGASRLVLFDSDWNPSHDLQAMARIHRDGQKHPVFIYRFLTAGTIDEKIYQRQVTKLGLADSLMGTGKAQSKSDSFSHKELRDIFKIHPSTGCQTHDLLECTCDRSNGPSARHALHSSVDFDLAAEDDEDDTEIEKGFVVASELRLEDSKMDKAYLKKQRAALAALGEWTHINCLRASSRVNIHDNILRNLIYVPEQEQELGDDGSKQKQSKSRLDSLLEAVDLEKVLALDDMGLELSPRDVPGGSISFLFERGVKTQISEDSEEVDS